MKATPNTFYDLEAILYQEEQEEQEEREEEEEMLEMWIEKLNRPGRVQERGGKEVTKEDVLKLLADEREQAMAEIMDMDSKEFQTRLFEGTLPDFMRERHSGLHRDTCHCKRMLTERDFELKMTCYGDVHRERLRYMSQEGYKRLAYDA